MTQVRVGLGVSVMESAVSEARNERFVPEAEVDHSTAHPEGCGATMSAMDARPGEVAAG